MISKLRRSIVIINMVLVGIVIFAIFTIVCYNSYSTAYDNLEHGLNEVITKNEKPKDDKFIGNIRSESFDDNDPDDYDDNQNGNSENPPPVEKLGTRENDSNGPMKISSYVTVNADSSGNILEYTENSVSIEKETLEECVRLILANNKKTGQLNEYSLIYVMRSEQNGIKIALADNSVIYSTLSQSIIISLALFAGSMIVIFFISLLLSGLAVKPVKKAWEQQKQFVADASHELKTPLTVILANNNIMMSHTDAKISDERQWLDSTQEEAQHMKELINQMLFLAKSDAGTAELQLSSVNLSEIVEGTTLNFEPVAFEREVVFDTQIEPEIAVTGNSTQLNQLAHILIDNAVKYSADQSVITVILSKKNDVIEFSVNNKGEIIKKEDIEHIFDRFYRAEKSRTTGGFGLGLSIAQRIAETMHGKITVKSDEESGTTFTVTLKAR